MDDKAQVTGIAWIVILFVITIAAGFFFWILLTPMFNDVFDIVNTNYVDTGEISQANYDSGNVVYYAWLALPIILVIGAVAGYLLRALVVRGF